MDGIRDLVKWIFTDAGMPANSIAYEPYLPGFYRPRKRWDMAVRYKGALVAALEFKSQVGSVGKNINNRFEEALGTGTDTWTGFQAARIAPPRSVRLACSAAEMVVQRGPGEGGCGVGDAGDGFLRVEAADVGEAEQCLGADDDR